MRSACSSARPIVSAAIRLRFATQPANTAIAPDVASRAGTMTLAKSDNTRDVLSRVFGGQTPFWDQTARLALSGRRARGIPANYLREEMEGCEGKRPRFAV